MDEFSFPVITTKEQESLYRFPFPQLGASPYGSPLPGSVEWPARHRRRSSSSTDDSNVNRITQIYHLSSPVKRYGSMNSPGRWDCSLSSPVRRNGSLNSPGRWDSSLTSPARSDDGGCSWGVFSEEKMDVLWEDFNEEAVVGVKAPRGRKQGKKGLISGGGCRDGGLVVDICCGQAMRMARGGSMLQRRRQSMGAMVKLLKRILLVQHKSSPKKLP